MPDVSGFGVEDVGPDFVLRFPGICPYCGYYLVPGDWVAYVSLYDAESGESDGRRLHCGACVAMFRRSYDERVRTR